MKSITALFLLTMLAACSADERSPNSAAQQAKTVAPGSQLAVETDDDVGMDVMEEDPTKEECEQMGGSLKEGVGCVRLEDPTAAECTQMGGHFVNGVGCVKN